MVETLSHRQGLSMLLHEDCRKKYPKQYWSGAATAAAVLVIAGVVALVSAQAYPPFHRPTLQITTPTVTPGDNLGFVQALVNPRHCPQETVRLMWRWEDSTYARRVVVPLSDANVLPRVWAGPTVIAVHIPANTSPGEWYYFRETLSWCSLWNYIAGPTVQRTADVPFTVRAP